MSHKILLYIQPAYNYKLGRIEYAEILVRNYRGIDSVKNIMRFVTRNNIEEQFDFEVLQETLRVMRQTPKLSYPIGINLCSKTAEKPDIACKIIKEIDKYNINHSDIIIEINESTDFKNENVLDNMRKLRQHGIKVALDDFGVDKSNLYTLVCSEVDILKVDRAFIDNRYIEYEQSQNTVLRMLLQLCNSLKMKPIVEGIETTKQLQNIEKLGYCVVQGYLYEKPKPYIEYMTAQG